MSIRFTVGNAGTYYDREGEPKIGRWIMVDYDYNPLKEGEYFLANKAENVWFTMKGGQYIEERIQRQPIADKLLPEIDRMIIRLKEMKEELEK